MKSRLTWFVIIAMIAGPLFGLFLHQTLGAGPAADSAAAGLSLVTTSFLRLIKNDHSAIGAIHARGSASPAWKARPQ